MRSSFGLIVLCALAIHLASCGSDSSSPSPQPTEKAMSAEQRASLLVSMDSLMIAESIPGAVIGIWRGSTEPELIARGFADISASHAMDTNKQFRIGGMTRLFLGQVVLQLADEGKLHLDDLIAQWIPQTPNADRITVRHLLGMTSGLADYTRVTSFQLSYLNNPTKVWSRATMFHTITSLTPDFAPNASCVVSASNAYLLGMIVEQVTGRSLEMEVKTRILDRLGLASTEFPDTEFLSTRASKGYRNFNTVINAEVSAVHPSGSWGGGAMISTIQDMKTMVQAVAQGKNLSEAMRLEMQNWRSFGSHSMHGLGVMNLGGLIGYQGTILGFSSIAVVLPSQDLTIVAFVNKCNDDGTRLYMDDLMRILIRVLFGSAYPFQ